MSGVYIIAFPAQLRGFKSLIAALAISAAPTALLAQETPPAAESDIEWLGKQRGEQDSRLVASGGPVDREASGFGGVDGFSSPVLELSSSDNMVLGTLALGYTKANANFTSRNSEGSQQVSAQIFKFGLEASVPFNGSKKEDVIDFRNIGNESEITMAATWYGTTYAVSAEQNDNIDKAYRQCVVQAIADSGSISDDARANFLSEFDGETRLHSENPRPALDIIEGLTGKFPKIIAVAAKPCIEDRGGEYIFRTYGEAAIGTKAYRMALRRRLAGSLKFFGAQASLGYGTHNVLNRAAFGLDQENRVGIDGRVYAGIISDDGRKSGRISVGYARGYEALDSVNFCRPDPSGTGETCISGEDGRPVRSENSYVSVEGRLGFGKTDFGPPQFAIAPQVTYRVEDKDFLFDLPVYLVRQADTGLSGGIRAAYDTGKDDFTMRVFVGVPFSTWF